MPKIKITFLVLAVICIVVGFIDLYLQISNGETPQWRVPIILIGFGVGLPLIIWFPFEWSSESNLKVNMSEEEYAQSNLGGGILNKNTGSESGEFSATEGTGATDNDDN